MYTKAVLLAFIGSAAAFNAPMMVSRREAMAGAAAVAVVAPLTLRPSGASAMDTQFRAPVVELFDERDGCKATGRKAKGGKTNDGDDQMCVKVSMQVIQPNTHLMEVVSGNYANLDNKGLQYVGINEHR
eukprot:CAMPEP_0173382090 /NCGR_PEP_ID=MMETSP1356-20130122/4564_1 /TAXON_ID=77927 ORGANISM="Hemiselmis virescens, Strain PCC157" /NCGR_SAMPLE_ID=MMETSP1356 /ASSEMBLY_ACC=CAM_ASM_000847 /LENGTH=128 /DNA_ID=CAMNT_0014336259 /DNA_START=50 /DNA_END=436 /DNA_ORIENTATION=+